MDFEAYLTSKRIDSARFKTAEPSLWQSWKTDFDQMHPNSFTVQKLNLINPVRRKYQLFVTLPPKSAPAEKSAMATASAAATNEPSVVKPSTPVIGRVAPKIPRPGMPKPVVPGASAPASAGDASPAPAEKEKADASQQSRSPEGAALPRPSEGESPPQADLPATHNAPVPPKPARPVIPRPIIKPKPKTD